MVNVVSVILKTGLALMLLWYSLSLFIYGSRWRTRNMLVAASVFAVLGMVWLFAALEQFTNISRLVLFMSMPVLFWLHNAIEPLLANRGMRFIDLLFFRR